jgi:uncharacterized protein YhjY with autotransporter beta-barrel domain
MKNFKLDKTIIRYCLLPVLLYFLINNTLVNAATGIATGTITPANLQFASPGQQATFQAFQNICTASLADASLACALTGGGVFSAAGPAIGNSLQLQQFSPQAGMQSESISISSPYQFVRNINRHVEQRHGCDSNQKNCISGGNGSYDAYGYLGPFGVSFSGGAGFGDRENSLGQTGFNLNTRFANLFIDYAFTKDLIGGVSFGYFSTVRDLGLASGSLDSDSYRFAPFISYFPTPESYVTLTGGYTTVNYSSIRKVSSFTNTANFTCDNVNIPCSLGEEPGTVHNDLVKTTITDATAKYSADQFFVSLGAGYTHRMGAWSLRGYGRADYNHLSISGFKENGGIAIGERLGEFGTGFTYTNTINGQNIDSLLTTLGAELSYAISTQSLLAAVIIPKLRAEWVHELKNGARQINNTFSANKFDNSQSISSLQSINVAGPERNWANLGLGVQMLLPSGIVGYLDYETLFIENGSNQTVSGGVRINF